MTPLVDSEKNGAKVIPFPDRARIERYLTAVELSEVLGMSERWIAYRVQEGLPSHRYGRSRRFKLSEVEDWLERRAS
jgi:excisionase family DNA binding protein